MAQQGEFQSIVSQAEYAEVRQMISLYEKLGFEIGFQRGLQQGIAQGMTLGMRRAILRQIALRFGMVPLAVKARIESIENLSELDDLADRVITAPTLEAMGLN